MADGDGAATEACLVGGGDLTLPRTLVDAAAGRVDELTRGVAANEAAADPPGVPTAASPSSAGAWAAALRKQSRQAPAFHRCATNGCDGGGISQTFDAAQGESTAKERLLGRRRRGEERANNTQATAREETLSVRHWYSAKRISLLPSLLFLFPFLPPCVVLPSPAAAAAAGSCGRPADCAVTDTRTAQRHTRHREEGDSKETQ
jgi:hypothetical protein